MIRKYCVNPTWIFNLESIHDKLWCIIYDIQSNKVTLPIKIAGRTIKDESAVYELMNEVADLECVAKSGKVTNKEYGKIKAIVNWEVNTRYTMCVANNQYNLAYNK